MSGDRDERDVGTVAEEAAKLLGALSGWARDATDDVEGHLAPGAQECTYCPICRAVHAVREVSPEVREQLASAAARTLQALVGLVSAAGSAARSTSAGGVEHIDLDEGADDWPDEHTDPEEGDR